jgi:hypothetical protein
MKKLIIVSIFHLLTFISIAQNKLPVVGLSTNHEGIIGWNNRQGNFGHLIPAPYNAFGNDTAYYYLRTRTKGMFDAQGNGGMHGNGNLTGFPLLSAKLTQYGKTIANIHVDFTDTDLDSDTKGTEWDLVNDVETRTYTGGNYIIRLDNDTLLVGIMPALHLTIDYNNSNTPHDDNIYGNSDYSSPNIYINNNQANSIKEIAKAMYQDINNLGLRFKFNSVQMAGQTEYDVNAVFAGYFDVPDAVLETSNLTLPNFQDTMYLCVNDSIKVDAGKGFGNYEWNTGFVGQIITIKQPGEYYVSFDYQGDRYTSKRILVVNKPVPQSPLPQDVTSCKSKNETFDKLIQNLHLNADLYLHTTDSNPMNGKTTVDANTYYYPIQYGCPTPIWGAMNIHINDPLAPSVSKIQEFCEVNNPKIHDLITTNNVNLVNWYPENVHLISLKHTVLLKHNTYYFATNTDIYGCESSEASEVLVKLNKNETTELSIKKMNASSNIISWKNTNNVTSYDIAYHINHGTITNKNSITDTFVIISNLKNNDSIHFTISFKNIKGCATTITHLFLISENLSLEKLTREQIQIFPNPSNDYITIKTDLNGISSFSMTDTYGKVVVDSKNFTNKINLKDLTSGIYFIHFFDKELNPLYTEKVIVE